MKFTSHVHQSSSLDIWHPSSPKPPYSSFRQNLHKCVVHSSKPEINMQLVGREPSYGEIFAYSSTFPGPPIGKAIYICRDLALWIHIWIHFLIHLWLSCCDILPNIPVALVSSNLVVYDRWPFDPTAGLQYWMDGTPKDVTSSGCKEQHVLISAGGSQALLSAGDPALPSLHRCILHKLFPPSFSSSFPSSESIHPSSWHSMDVLHMQDGRGFVVSGTDTSE